MTTLRSQPAARFARAPRAKSVLNRTVLVSTLGYFVDIYDLLLFSIVRVPSVRSLGVPESELLDAGVYLLNLQMAGLLVGGILWGVLGDRRGRVSVLFGSIALYSVANLANAFVSDVETYGALRFVAGVGLAGELGAAITLVSEVMTRETRGYGAAVVAGIGILGAVGAWLVGSLFDWRAAYAVGGILGLLLLATRYKLRESGLFRSLSTTEAPRGELRLLFGSSARVLRYARCVLIGLPIWFTVGVLVTFSPELARDVGIEGEVSAGVAVAASYTGAAFGSLLYGYLSERWQSRWLAVYAGLVASAALLFTYLFSGGSSADAFYVVTFLLGFSVGYWPVFVLQAAEQFGTNLRATVTTTVPNFIRGSVVPITLAFQAVGESIGLGRSALLVGIGCVLIALWSLRGLEETYAKDLDYLET